MVVGLSPGYFVSAGFSFTYRITGLDFPQPTFLSLVRSQWVVFHRNKHLEWLWLSRGGWGSCLRVIYGALFPPRVISDHLYCSAKHSLPDLHRDDWVTVNSCVDVLAGDLFFFSWSHWFAVGVSLRRMKTDVRPVTDWSPAQSNIPTAPRPSRGQVNHRASQTMIIGMFFCAVRF